MSRIAAGALIAMFVLGSLTISYYVMEYRWNLCRSEGYSVIVCAVAATR